MIIATLNLFSIIKSKLENGEKEVDIAKDLCLTENKIEEFIAVIKERMVLV